MGRPAPIVSVVFVTVLVAVYFALLAVGASPFFPDFGELLRFGGVRADKLADGQWWRLVTAVVVHAGALHLVVNAWPLYRLGAVLEPLVGPRVLALTILLTGSGAFLASTLADPRAVTTGASGVVSGLVGVLLGLALRGKGLIPDEQRATLFQLVSIVVVVEVMLALTEPTISVDRHVVAFDTVAHAAGAGLGLLIGWSVAGSMLERSSSPSLALPLAVVVGLAVVSTEAHRPSPERPLVSAPAEKVPLFSRALVPDADLPALRAYGRLRLGDARGLADARVALTDARTTAPQANNLAWALLMANQELPLALELADRSLALQRTSVALSTRCWVRVALGALQQARADCEAAVQEAATPVDEGMLAWLDGRPAEALRLWESAPGSSVADRQDLAPWILRARAAQAGRR